MDWFTHKKKQIKMTNKLQTNQERRRWTGLGASTLIKFFAICLICFKILSANVTRVANFAHNSGLIADVSTRVFEKILQKWYWLWRKKVIDYFSFFCEYGSWIVTKLCKIFFANFYDTCKFFLLERLRIFCKLSFSILLTFKLNTCKLDHEL